MNVNIAACLAPTENLRHFHTPLPFTCADDSCIFLACTWAAVPPLSNFTLREVSSLLVPVHTVFLLNAAVLLTSLCASSGGTFLLLSFSLSVCCWLETTTSHLATARLSTRSLHCIQRRPAVCSRSGFNMFQTLLRVIVWAICAHFCTCGVTAVCCTTLISP